MTKRKSKGRRSKKVSTDFGVVITIIFSILLTVLIYTESGYIGIMLSDFFGGMFGIIKYVLPIGSFAVAIKMACKNDDGYISSRIFQYSLLLIFIAVILSVYQICNGQINIEQNISDIVKDAYALGANNIGGGALGTIAAVPLFKLLGKVGTIILSIGLALIMFSITFGIDISKIISNWIEAGVEKSKEKRESRIVAREELDDKEELTRAEIRKEGKRAKTIKENRKAYLEVEDDKNNEVVPEQIKINLNGRTIEEDASGRKKFKHAKNGIVPLEIENKQKMEPDYIEGNLFKKEEEKKEEKVKEVLQLEHAVAVEDEHYEYPPVELLSKGTKKAIKGGAKALTDVATRLQKTLYSFGVQAKVENVSVGPAITRYELKPAEGVRVSKIANLADDIALNLAAETIRIEAPIPGKQAVGIEVPNTEKETVHFRDVVESDAFQDSKSKLSVALGKDVAGNMEIADIAKMPHALIAGATGSGKSVCINTIITSIIYKAKPSEVKFVMVDPKVVELSVYNGIPHLLIPVVTDPKKAAGALAWAVQEMDNRYNVFAQKGVRDLKGYNALAEKEEGTGTLPQIVIIIDELADLMMVASKEVEESIMRITQLARAAGIHLIVATQRPSTDVITGLIKSNIPTRISFMVSSNVDSRTILDMGGAEKLLGKGDMLFLPPGEPSPIRIQGSFVSDEEINRVVEFVKRSGTPVYDEKMTNLDKSPQEEQKELESTSKMDEDDPLYNEVVEFAVRTGKISASLIQRKYRLGYNRAARIIDLLEERGIIGPQNGSKPREVLFKMNKEETGSEEE